MFNRTLINTWLIIASRNLIKNKRRSIFTMIAIMLGYSAVVLFDGYINYMFASLKESYVYSSARGHLTIFKNNFLEKGKVNPEKYLISRKELQQIKDIVAKKASVLIMSPELHINGLISNGELSTIFFAVGKRPSNFTKINGYAKTRIGSGKYYTGSALSENDIYGIGLGESLANLLKVNIGSNELTLLSPTVDGTMNALDANLKQTFLAADEKLEDKLASVTLGFAQSLYDTESVDRVRLLLRDDSQLNQVKLQLQQLFKDNRLDVKIRDWIELSPFYVKAKNMFEFIFIFIFIIVLSVSLMSIINTLGMSIMERTREIGTMRAIGLTRSGVIGLFVIESFLLSLIGVICGFFLALGVQQLIEILDIYWLPPQLSMAVPLEINLNYFHMLIVFAILQLTSVFAAVLTARRAAYKIIIDALRYA